MTTILVSPQVLASETGSEAIRLQVFVKETEDLSLFDRLEVWRSTEGPNGPYDELTAACYLPARLPKTAGDPPSPAVVGPGVALDGEVLLLLLDETDELTVTFAGVDPITFADAAAQIVTQGLGRLASYVDAAGALVVETVSVGVKTTLEVLLSTGAVQLQLPTDLPGSRAHGRDVRPSLSGAGTYTFVDPHGSRAFYYKTRYRSTFSGATSDFSQPFSGDNFIAVPPENIACGQVRLVTADGHALKNAEVQVAPENKNSLVGDVLVADYAATKSTDENGLVEFPLIRGLVVTVAIPGTHIQRRVTVPTDPAVTFFNLLDPALGVSDAFKVAQPVLVAAERRTL